LAFWDCLAEKANLAAAILSFVAATGTTIVLLLAPEPTTLTKWGSVFTAVGALGALAWIISAIISLIDCLKGVGGNEDEIKELQETQKQLEEKLEELEKRLDEIQGN